MNTDIYRVIAAPDHLLPFVRRILIADCLTNVEHSIPVRPTGRGYLGWFFRGDCVVKREGQIFNDGISTDFLHSSGQVQDTGITVNYSGKAGHLFAEFTALGFYQLLGITGADCFEEFCSPLNLNPALENDLAPMLKHTDRPNVTGEQALDAMLVVLTQLAQSPRPVVKYLVDAVAAMEAVDGAILVSDLYADLPVSSRQFTREFTRMVGVSPKYFCRVLQLNGAIEEMVQNDGENLAQVAIQSGFTDQAHFGKMFREFMMSSPLEFLNGNEDMLITVLSNRRS